MLEVLGLLGLGIYAYLTYLMYCETKKAAEAAHDSAVAAKSASDTADATLKSTQKSFIIDQRPYMVIDSGPNFLAPGPIANTPVVANITFKNIGKTPAVQVVLHFKLMPYRASLVAKLTPEQRKKARAEFISFMQSAFAKLRADDEKTRKEILQLTKYSAGQDVAPTKTMFISSQDPISISGTDIPLLNSGELMLFYIGVVSYIDSYGEIYKTEFCSFYFGTDPNVWHICDAHNTIR